MQYHAIETGNAFDQKEVGVEQVGDEVPRPHHSNPAISENISDTNKERKIKSHSFQVRVPILIHIYNGLAIAASSEKKFYQRQRNFLGKLEVTITSSKIAIHKMQ
jgi:hypothetical protein